MDEEVLRAVRVVQRSGQTISFLRELINSLSTDNQSEIESLLKERHQYLSQEKILADNPWLDDLESLWYESMQTPCEVCERGRALAAGIEISATTWTNCTRCAGYGIDWLDPNNFYEAVQSRGGLAINIDNGNLRDSPNLANDFITIQQAIVFRTLIIDHESASYIVIYPAPSTLDKPN